MPQPIEPNRTNIPEAQTGSKESTFVFVNMRHHFHCEFAGGTVANVDIDTSVVQEVENYVGKMQWNQTPDENMIGDAFREWLHYINQTITDDMGISYRFKFATEVNKRQLWLYRPGKTKELVRTEIYPTAAQTDGNSPA